MSAASTQVSGRRRAGSPHLCKAEPSVPPAAPRGVKGPPVVPVGVPPGTCRADGVPRVRGARASSLRVGARTLEPVPAPTRVTSPQASPEGGLGAPSGVGELPQPHLTRNAHYGARPGLRWGAGAGRVPEAPLGPQFPRVLPALRLLHSCDFRPGVCPPAPSRVSSSARNPHAAHYARLKCSIPRLCA